MENHNLKVKNIFKASLLALIAMASGAAQKVWPAGVSPAACPDYPNCNNNIDPTLGVPRGSLNVPGIPALQSPAGVAAAACPDFPFCTQRSEVPVGYTNTAGYPAGVNAAACPNFPYC